jgi:hypothetical protein
MKKGAGNIKKQDRINKLNKTTLSIGKCAVRLCDMFLIQATILELYIGRTLFFHGAKAPSGPGPPHYRSLTITLRHNTLGRTPLDE